MAENKKLNDEISLRAMRLISMIHVMQFEIDELEKHKLVFRHGLKQNGKAFQKSIESFLKEFYGNLDDDANLIYNYHLSAMEELLKAYISGDVEVKEDNNEQDDRNDTSL